jgi:hypothetical protein
MAVGQIMNINLKGMVFTLGVVTLPLLAGCETRQANAETVQVFTNATPPPGAVVGTSSVVGSNVVVAGSPVPVAAASGSGVGAGSAVGVTTGGVEAAGATLRPGATNLAAAGTTNLVQPAVVLETMNLSPALAEVVKLIQAGVSQEVVMAYVTNSTGLFNVGSS